MHRADLRFFLFASLAFILAISAAGAAFATESVLHLPPLKPGHTRPLIAIAADNAGTETTDLVVPYGVISDAGIADITIVSTHQGAIDLMPALKIMPDTTMSEFDRAHPEGADIIIVPAMHDSRNSDVVSWIGEQSSKRAVVVSICEGAWLAARAGVFEGRRATTHWYAFDKIRHAFPHTHWVRDQRYVVDGSVVSTTGVTASIPVSLALVDAIAGPAKARSVATHLGVSDWGISHDTSSFRMTTSRLFRFAQNSLAFWRHETVRLPVRDGFDEIALALTADAWSRTYRSQAIVAEKSSLIRSRNGLVLIPETPSNSDGPALEIPAFPSAQTLDHALSEISSRYGESTADIVSLQLEYPAKP
ncbi:thiamine biosynthesis protein ThiJ [Rhizobium sp. P38BS-XIX]|uniref:DJ-1/PfpI family protein n=1 Tax=Rhizobium sp. P38BS-XIX TaxID=2726740 RepID=UPI001456B6C9|nr:DJ-1/PfpI family protein [Rhizobium sp. P38BS-XIX]NLR98271.1 thiamine biosynthesis protein ThiJ [Rhizobium sp. P38BS-XIX]